MTRLGLVALGFLLVACKNSPPAGEPRTGDDDPGAGACETLDEAGCRARTDCGVIEGSKLDGDCSLPEAFAGCGLGDMACGDALTYTVDPDGDPWWFMDTCLPEGWASEPYPDGMSEPPAGC